MSNNEQILATVITFRKIWLAKNWKAGILGKQKRVHKDYDEKAFGPFDQEVRERKTLFTFDHSESKVLNSNLDFQVI